MLISQSELQRAKTDIQLRNEIVTQYLDVVRKQARRLGFLDGVYIEDDLVSVGGMALCKAISNYNPSKGIFVHYARMCIIYQMKTWIAIQRYKGVKVNSKIRTKLSKRSSGEVFDQETENKLDMVPKVEYNNARESHGIPTPTGTSLLLKMDVEKALTVLTRQEQRVIEMVYGLCGQDVKNVAEIGKREGVSAPRISQIAKAAESKLRTTLEEYQCGL